PSNGEMFLYYLLTTTAWFILCDLAPKYSGYIIPKKYNQYTRKILLGMGNIHYLNHVINNEKITGGIIFKF
ncbi:MAG: hypothetical protein ACTSRZ_20355, partial [Promethearchaeota archaeon]